MKNIDIRKKTSESLKKTYADNPAIREQQIETRKRNHPAKGPTMIEKLCDCGCR